MRIQVQRDILATNNELAAANRKRLQDQRRFAVNFMSSPGAGKTTLLEHTIDLLSSRLAIGVIEGDIVGSFDAERIRQHGVPTIQINTGSSCHLDARMVAAGIEQLKGDLDLVLVENVGNLVCPADFDLGESMKVALLSVTEGDDKPLKYPAVFRASSVLIINKTDLVPHTDCNLDLMTERALDINPLLDVFHVSCRTETGLMEWAEFLYQKVRSNYGRVEQ